MGLTSESDTWVCQHAMPREKTGTLKYYNCDMYTIVVCLLLITNVFVTILLKVYIIMIIQVLCVCSDVCITNNYCS